MKQFCYDYARTQDVLVLPALDLSGTLRQPSCTDSMREGQAAQDLYSTALCRLTVSRCHHWLLGETRPSLRGRVNQLQLPATSGTRSLESLYLEARAFRQACRQVFDSRSSCESRSGKMMWCNRFCGSLRRPISGPISEHDRLLNLQRCQLPRLMTESASKLRPCHMPAWFSEQTEEALR